VCCQKVSEAEVLVEGGIGDVFIANEVAGAGKLDRLAALALRARIAVCVDDIDNVAEIEAAAARAGASVDVLVEIDVGGRRCGTQPGAPAARIAEAVARSPHLRFAGLQAYHGSAQHVREARERSAQIARAVEAVKETQAALKAVGLVAATVTGAGTGTYENEAASTVYTELQAGSYIFMDADYAKNVAEGARNASPFEHALFVLATVMSVASGERVVVDAGHKALSNDSGFPSVRGRPDLRYHRPSDEHGVLEFDNASSRPAVGDRLTLIPGHCDPTVNLYDWYVGVRGFDTPAARVEALWPIAARGAVT
jgi:D-serine deaminase-like pyridoxal phosphate-dependent protein